MCTRPSIDDFKSYFNRDFPFAQDAQVPDLETEIANEDIQRAMDESDCMFNDALFLGDEHCCRTAFLYLSAHYLTENIRNSNQGLSGTFEGLLSSKSVGSVSSGFQFPPSFLEDPTYMMLAKTTYGAKYLNMLYPRLRGAVFTVSGRTTP